MSIKLMSLVWDTEIGPAVTRLVLLALADSANDEGVCWPSMQTLARKANCGLSTAREAVASLEADGYLNREIRPISGGRNQSNRYWLDLTAIQGAAEIRREVPPESGGSAAEIERQNRKGNRKKEPGEAIASRDEHADGDQLALVPAAVEVAGSQQNSPDELVNRAMRIYMDNWDRARFGAPANADVTERWVREIAHRFDCDPLALFAAVEMAAVRGKVSPAPAYQPAPLDGKRLTKAAQAVARAVYDAQSGEVNFGALMQRAKTAIKAGRSPEDVHAAMIRLFEAGKPITQQLVAQYAEQVRLANESLRGVVQS